MLMMINTIQAVSPYTIKFTCKCISDDPLSDEWKCKYLSLISME